MIEKLTPQKIWGEYTKGKDYNTALDLYETVKRNENFYIGNQWEGVIAPDLEKPVINVLKRTVNYFVSQIVSDDIGVSFTAQTGAPDDEIITDTLEKEVEKVIEDAELSAKGRRHLRNCAVDGDCAIYGYYDSDYDNGQLIKGRICADIVDNTNIIFGNPSSSDVQSQPHIIIVKRSQIGTVKKQAAGLGLSQNDIEQIKADKETEYYREDKDETSDLVTELIRFEKISIIANEQTGEKKTVMLVSQSVKNLVLYQKTLEYELYPVAYMSWDEIKNSYHGQSAVTGMIVNQIYINKMWAMMMHHQKTMAFPKVFYDQQKLPDGITNKVGQAVPTIGPPTGVIATSFKPSDMSSQAMMIVEKTIGYTRDMMGASDAALGNIKPDNTSAIIAVQKATAAPLELQRLAYYQYTEAIVRVIVDMIRVHYGARPVQIEQNGQKQQAVIDFGQVNYKQLQLRVDIGPAAYWSELMQVQTIDNLYSKQIITDPVKYLESIPDAYIRNKGKLIKDLRERQNMLQQIQGGMANAMPIV